VLSLFFSFLIITNGFMMMYHDFFGLNAAPFKITPDPQLFYAGGQRGLALEALIYAILHGEGIVKVVGEVGSGKTMLCRMLERKLPASVLIIYLANPSLSPELILHAIAFEMNLPIRAETNRLEVMRHLQHSLLQHHSENRQVVIFIEEAQSMPVATLEEIRLLSNLETAHDKLLQIVLFGQPELDELLSAPHIRQLKERITHSIYLMPLHENDIQDYLYFRMQSVGYRGLPVFTKKAIRTLYDYSQGLIRRINILADKSLLAAYMDNQQCVQVEQVKRAAQDSGFVQEKKLKLLPSFILIAVIIILIIGAFWFLPHGFYWKYQLAPSTIKKETHEITHSIQLEPVIEPVELTPIITEIETENKPTPEITINTTTITLTLPELLQERLKASELWLQQSDSQHYSIQILHTSYQKTAELTQFLQREELAPLLPSLFLYHKDQQWNVFYGTFIDENTALFAINELPESIRRNRPYVRRLSALIPSSSL
jgi:MSHA biogenesis protein MshM